MAKTHDKKKAGANDSKNLSLAGVHALRANEGVRNTYYNDTANNCTYGVGTLAHMGPCTPQELNQPVSAALIQGSLHQGVLRAERIVRRAVTDHELTQAQFDAAVSFAYNVPGGAHHALSPANQGNMASVARNMRQYVYEHPHDDRGRVSGPGRLNHGLVQRRARESAPFQGAGQ
ncbi:lysozyme [Trinickia sp.]|uniref:lysozyme n=1 Tax=Trinickia sp. TaxID=2571163 RepID=UPI003F7D432A